MANTNRQVTLTILETSDLHGNVLPLNYGNNQESDVGLAKISTLIQRERQQNEHTIVIDNGDLIQGTPLLHHYAQFGGETVNPMVLLLNTLQFDAAVIGNHEFNFGQNILQRAVQQSRFPWLSANVLDASTKQPFFGKPYLIKNIKPGIKVAILGLTTHYIPHWENPAHIAGIVFEDAVEAAAKWVRFLREKAWVDVVVVSYHGGFERDPETGDVTERLTGENQGYRLCTEIEGIDVLLTGHQHRMIAGVTVNSTIVVQPGSQGSALGKVTVTLERREKQWQMVDKSSELLSVKNVAADPQMVTLVKPYENETQKWLDQPIGKIEGDMRVHDPFALRLQDNALIEFFNKVQMHVADVDISCTSLFDNDCPGIPSDVSMRDVMANYIYPNTLKVLRLTGRDIKAALEKTATYFAAYDGKAIRVNPAFAIPKPQHYNYDMWEGIDYVINVSRPVGERITKLHYNGKPIDPAQTFDVVMNNYRAGGGGDYLMFQEKPVIREIQTDVPQLIADYIVKRGTIKATVNHNWKVVHD